MSVIQIRVDDQQIALTNMPVIASGGIEENQIEFDFSSDWAGFACVACFYRENKSYTSLISATGVANVPNEVVATDGKMWLGVMGVKDGVTKTSELVFYKILQGAITEDFDPGEPTPDIYNQILDYVSNVVGFDQRLVTVENRSSTNASNIATQTGRIDNMINSQQNASVKTLWTGTLVNKNQSVTLSESASNFDFIDVYVGGADTIFARQHVSNYIHFELEVQNMADDGSSQFMRWWESGLTISGTTATITKAIRCYWDDFSQVPVVSEAGTGEGIGVVRIDGVKIGHVEDDEIVDARVGADGTAYPTLGDSIRGQNAQILDGIDIKTNWIDSSTLTTNQYGGYYIPIYADEDEVIELSCDNPTNGLRVNWHYADGTSAGSKIFSDGVINVIKYRTPKKLTRVGLYVDNDNETTFTVRKLKSPSLKTNHYDKTTAQEGYISGNGAIISGNYRHTGFIPCEIGDVVYYPGYPSTYGTPYLFMFDAEKNFLGRRQGVLQESGLYKTSLLWDAVGSAVMYPNVAYCAFNLTVTSVDTAVCYINEIPETNLEYGQVQPDSDLFFNAQQKEYIGNAGGVPISGKKIAYNGDSICESRMGTSTSSNGGAYAKLIADLTNGTYDNRGRGGGTLASGTSATRQVVNDVTNMPNDADLICFEGGINDYWLSVPLGDYVESDFSSTLDTTTICGALESVFRQAKEKWVGKPICFIIVHKIKSTVYVANSQGYTFAQAREKMIGICEKYAIPYYDAFAKSGLNAYDNVQNNAFLTSNSTGTADGCHPNEEGYKKYYVPQLIDLFNSIMPRN